MPDKPLETTWAATRLLPTLRRGRRFARRRLRQVRSRIRPRFGTLGAPRLVLPGAVHLGSDVVASQVRGVDAILVAVPESTDQIPADYLTPLISAEQHSVPTVLLVTAAAQLDHPLAAVVTHLVTDDPQLVEPVEAFAGSERTALLDSQASAGARAAALRRLTRVHTPVRSRR